jgi:hypothetical protein
LGLRDKDGKEEGEVLPGWQNSIYKGPGVEMDLWAFRT